MKAVCLISGGIDSPVAAYVMSRVGAEVALLHMDNRPFANDHIFDRVTKLAERLRSVTGQEMPLYSAPHGPSQKVIYKTCERPYQCVMCKRTMQRTARELAKGIGASAIVMGDSLGQVASQTLHNIRFENAGLNFPVLRPLIGYDKLEIEAIAKEIGTYELSILPALSCSIVPQRPVTEARPDKIAEFDAACDIEELYGAAIRNAVRVS
ncbi:MAG: tRNA 4-thiouridine(8) synthase ThiI [Candidatus Methanoplasma sp.]|jgi:thiamine biosynthesis protein ThiI|nr:tRNA 4-thiouridine(8) synthase ThiI [Candidatus Methanoplasma sp.]